MSKTLFSNKNFLLLWSSQVLSQLSINIMNFIVLINIYETTNSTIAASIVWVAYGIPAIILGPVAAAAVDMMDRRKILMLANIIQAIEILIYALLVNNLIFISYGIVAAYSLMDQLYVPAEAATLPTLVKKNKLAEANGLFFISAQSSAILGFGFAGLISEAIGTQTTVFLGSLMLLFAFFSTSMLPPAKAKIKITGKSLEDHFYSFLGRMKEGYVFIRHNNRILYPFLFMMWLQVSLSILVVNLPAIGEKIIQVRPAQAGPLVVGPAGVGALIGTVLLPKILKSVKRKIMVVETALIAMAATFIFVSVAVPFFEFWIARLLLVLAFLIIGFSYVSALIPSVTFMQEQTPSKLMGRLFGNFWFLANTATLIPVIFSATITDLLGVNLMLLLMGFAALGIFFLLKIRIYPLISNEIEVKK